MSKTPDPPFTKDAMAKELREIIVIQAGFIAHVGNQSAADEFLGFPCELEWSNEPSREIFDRIDLNHFRIWESMSRAFDYAFQVGRCWFYGQEEHDDVEHFRRSIPEKTLWGYPMPYQEPNSKVRHVVELAGARATLDGDFIWEEPITVRHLSLLANMSEAAVRNSLSAAKISSPVEVETALSWLKDRKGFVPTRKEENRAEEWVSYTSSRLSAERLATELEIVLHDLDLTPEAAASAADMSVDEIRSLMGEHSPVLVSIDKLQKLGSVLKADGPRFVGQAMEAILRRLG